MAPQRPRGRLRYATSIADAVTKAWLIVESVPERLDVKQSVYAEIERSAANDALIASSTSGILPSELQAAMAHPERLLVAHPFNPVYLLPLVELFGGKLTAPAAIDTAADFYATLGMKPLKLRREIDAFVADRLLEAVWRESLWLIKDGVATTEELDDAIRFGFGLRWAQMGIFETYRIAGGEAGMQHFLDQFGPTLSWPWTKLMDVPELDDELTAKIASQSDAQSGMYSIRELERIRDDNLIGFLQVLKSADWGAGKTLAAYEKRLYDVAANVPAEPEKGQPVETLAIRVPTDWTDYNGHMNESRYLQCFSDATDGFMRQIGVDQSYIENDGSFFTAETHICHLAEVRALEAIRVTTQVLAGEGKKMHLFHRLFHVDGTALATAEQLFIHVDLSSRKASVPTPDVAETLASYAAAHAALPAPEQQGRYIGARR
jgi:carnitine 3-dehydrogenase